MRNAVLVPYIPLVEAIRLLRVHFTFIDSTFNKTSRGRN